MTTKQNNKKNLATAPPADPLSAVLQQVETTGTAQGFTVIATPEERKQVSGRIHGCSMDLIHEVAGLATDNGGSILGTSYDASGSLATVDRYRATTRYVAKLRLLAQQAEDTVSGELANLSDETMSVMSRMKRARNTPAGKAFQATYKDLRKLVPGNASPAKAPATTTPSAPSATAPVTAPTTATVPAPSTHPTSGSTGSGSSGASGS